MVTLKEIIYLLINEAKSIFKEYMHNTEVVLKKRIKKIMIFGIITGVLVSLIISFLGSASLFILIGSLRYLETSMPAWAAWYIIGITSGVTGGILILILYLIIRKQFKTTNTKNKENVTL
jgi:hypothetical protein